MQHLPMNLHSFYLQGIASIHEELTLSPIAGRATFSLALVGMLIFTESCVFQLR